MATQKTTTALTAEQRNDLHQQLVALVKSGVDAGRSPIQVAAQTDFQDIIWKLYTPEHLLKHALRAVAAMVLEDQFDAKGCHLYLRIDDGANRPSFDPDQFLTKNADRLNAELERTLTTRSAR